MTALPLQQPQEQLIQIQSCQIPCAASMEQFRHFDSAFDSPGEVWYAELLLLFSFKTRGPVEPEVALVQWFEPVPRPAHAGSIRLPFQHAKVKLTGIHHKVFHVDVVTLTSILGSCFMQPDPINSNILYHNHWVGNTANATG